MALLEHVPPGERPSCNGKRLDPAEGNGSPRNPLHRTARWTCDVGAGVPDRVAALSPQGRNGERQPKIESLLVSRTPHLRSSAASEGRGTRTCRIRTRQENRFVISRGWVDTGLNHALTDAQVALRPIRPQQGVSNHWTPCRQRSALPDHPIVAVHNVDIFSLDRHVRVKCR